MITIWVHSKYLDEFVKVLENIDYKEEIETKFYTFPKGKDYIQMLITYTEYKNLLEKNNV